MVNHFYLIYFNLLKWMESTRFLNNERRYSVAEGYIYLIIGEWVVFIVSLLVALEIVPDDFIFNNKWTSIWVVTIFCTLIYFVINSIFKNTINNLEYKYSNILNWKRSGYRKRALFYTVFYFVFFPIFIIGFCILIFESKKYF